MELLSIPSRFGYPKYDPQRTALAIHKFNQIFMELGVRKDNEHIGSGLGGNNFQILTLLTCKHHLVDESATGTIIQLRFTNHMYWGINHLADDDLRTIRQNIDIFFPEIPEKAKLMALSLQALPKNANFIQVVEDHLREFPKVANVIRDGKYKHVNRLSTHEQLMVAYILCVRLAGELDKGIKKNIQMVGQALDNFSDEIILMSVRQFIQIQRLVKFNLDDDAIFGPMLTRICNTVKARE